MNKISILIIIMLLSISCSEKKNILKNCQYDLSDEVLTLSGSNQTLLHLVILEKRNEKIIEITIELHKASAVLMDQAGGLNESGRFVDRFNRGYISDSLLNSLRNNINIIVNDMNTEDYSQYKRNEPILTSSILDKKSIYYIGNSKKTYLETALALLVIENSLLIESVCQNAQ